MTNNILLPKHELFDGLRALNMPSEQYAIFGSGPMWLRSIRESDDLDLVVRSDFFQELMKREDKTVIEKYNRPVIQFANGKIEIYDFWQPGEWSLDELIDTADMVEGVRFVSLENVLKWKQLWAREKDLRDVELIRNYLVNNIS